MKLPPLPGLVWIIVLWALFYAAQNAHGQNSSAKPDTRVVIDVSGSMKKTDPQNLRVPSVKLLLNLATDQGQFGVWSFGRQVNNLVPLAPVTADWKKAAAGKVNAIHSRGLFTNIGAALEAATLGQTQPDPTWDRTIVLLSDGMVDISKDPAANVAEQKRIFDTIVPKLKAAGFKLRTVALSDQADHEFLKNLALQTNGSFILARTAAELLPAFVDTSDKVNAPEQVPLEGDSFAIDDSVKEFTALIFRKSGIRETRIVAPDGTEYSLANGSRNLSWFADKQYDLITVYNPVAGKWKVLADIDPSSRVTVVSDLELEIEGLPDNVQEGEKVTMNMFLAEQGRAITNPRFLELMDITFSQTTASGETFEGKLSQDAEGNPKIPEDGIYSAKLGRTLTAGEHTFSVLVDGKTFKRKKIQKMSVYHDVMAVTTEYRDDNGKVFQFLVAEPHPGMVKAESLQLTAQIQDSKGEKSLQNARLRDDGRWQIDVPPFGTLGNYDVLIKVTGTSANGKPFELVQGPYSVDYTPVGMETVAEAATAVPAPDEQNATPPVTFDASAMDIPSLDVEELPPEDMVLPPPTPVQDVTDPLNSDMPAAQVSDEPHEAEPESGGESSWLLWSALFILGNVAIVGCGLYFYLRFLRKTDVEQSRVVEEITQLKQRQKEDRARSANAAASVASAEAEVETELEDATVMRTFDATPPESAAAATPEAPAVMEPPEESYSNKTPALELEDESIIEIDDYDDELPDDVDNLDDLDMMLNDQEEIGSDTEINQTIDQMLDAPTVFPGKKRTQEEEDAERFAEDEFMLDNPGTKKK